MLKEILQLPHSSRLLKILFKNQQSLIIDYPNYEILAVSESMLPGLNVVGKKAEEIDSPLYFKNGCLNFFENNKIFVIYLHLSTLCHNILEISSNMNIERNIFPYSEFW